MDVYLITENDYSVSQSTAKPYKNLLAEKIFESFGFG